MTDYLARAMEQEREEQEDRAARELDRLVRQAEANGRWAKSSAGQEQTATAATPAAVEEPESPRPGTERESASAVERALGKALWEDRTVTVKDEAQAAELLGTLRRAQEGAAFARGQRRAFTVTLPEAAPVGAGWSVEELDRTVERDARRYDGGFGLY